MDVDETRNVKVCPYCGSKELVEESDQVTMQRIKSHAWKEVQKDKEETKRAVNNAREITERQKSSDSKKETYITLITVIVLAMIGAAMCLFKII